MAEGEVICCSCGRKAEFSATEPPCAALSGWLMVSHCKGLGSVEHQNFCSFACLRRWAESNNTEIPQVFIKSFADDLGEKNDCL
jgi:hypothetical protein